MSELKDSDDSEGFRIMASSIISLFLGGIGGGNTAAGHGVDLAGSTSLKSTSIGGLGFPRDLSSY